MEILREILNKTEEEAEKFCKDNNFVMRVIRRDNSRFCITMDYRFDRINVEIVKGKIIKADIG